MTDVMVDSRTLSRVLLRCVKSRATSPLSFELDTLERDLRIYGEAERFRQDFATAARRFGRSMIHLTETEIIELQRLGVTWLTVGTVDDIMRLVMLSTAAACLPGSIFQSLLQDCYDGGDSRERRVILRALPVFPDAERFVPLAVDACRSVIHVIFEAIACENSYPARHFPDLHFNQMVLKALFTETALNRIIGLERRMTSELIRMADDFVSERRAAGRSISPDIQRLLKPVDER